MSQLSLSASVSVQCHCFSVIIWFHSRLYQLSASLYLMLYLYLLCCLYIYKSHFLGQSRLYLLSAWYCSVNYICILLYLYIALSQYCDSLVLVNVSFSLYFGFHSMLYQFSASLYLESISIPALLSLFLFYIYKSHFIGQSRLYLFSAWFCLYLSLLFSRSV